MRFQPILLATASIASTLLLFSPAASSHGGTYLGPGDTVPAGGSGTPGGALPGGPASGGAGQPSPPAPGDPSPGVPGRGGPRPGNGPGKAPSTGGGFSQDLTAWTFWWEFNKPSYLALREALEQGPIKTGSSEWYLGLGQAEQAVDIRRPSKGQIRDLVVPALLATLAKETNNDVVTGALMALAKIGDTTREDGSSAFAETIGPWLQDSNQEISETSVLALGILGHERSVELLIGVLGDDAAGRAVTGRGEVPRRTRTFAAYALGLIGRTTADASLKTSILNELRTQLLDRSSSTRDIAVACVLSMGLFTPDQLAASPSDPGATASLDSCESQLSFLIELFQDKTLSRFVRAHCPTAMVRILELRGDDLSDQWTPTVAGVLLDAMDKSNIDKEVLESCVLALGSLGDSDSDSLDRRIRQVLIGIPAATRDQQARNFSLISLAQVAARPGSDDSGLEQIKSTLLTRLSGSKNALRPWSALAIGVMARGMGERFPGELEHALVFELEQQRGPRIAPYAVAAGLLGSYGSTNRLLKKLDQIQDDAARGYMCLALGMIGDRKALQPVQELVRQSTYRAELLRQASIGLGLMGDQGAVPELLRSLERTKSLATKAAIADALGFIGDRRSIEPLIAMLQDSEGTALARGFAAAALGNICDPRPLPWNTPISRNLNYRASTETLTGLGGRGILDIL